ncbi:MAG TPA: hypothetical protein VF988_16400 [Verrucomicrobiae bacterium]
MNSQSVRPANASLLAEAGLAAQQQREGGTGVTGVGYSATSSC